MREELTMMNLLGSVLVTEFLPKHKANVNNHCYVLTSANNNNIYMFAAIITSFLEKVFRSWPDLDTE